MRTRRFDPLWSPVAVAVLAMAAVAGCGDDDRSPSGGTLTTVGPGPGSSGSGASGGTGGMTGVGGSGGEISDTPCEAPAQAAVELYGAGTDQRLTTLVPVGNRWLAAGQNGYVRFDRDGSNADANPTTLGGTGFNVLTEEPGAIGYASAGSNYVGYQRLGENDLITGPRSLSMDSPNGVATAAADMDAVTVWADNGAFWGRTVDAAGTLATEEFLVLAGAYTTNVRMHGLSGAGEMYLFWNGPNPQGLFQSQLLRVGPTGPGTNTPNAFYGTPYQHDLVQVVAIDDGFMALVFDDAGIPRFLRLDDNGNLTHESPGLAGVQLVYGMASQGNQVAIVAGRETGEPELRVFDLALSPVGPWVCLGTDHDSSVPAAIAADGTGYAAIFQTGDGATMLGRVDAMGTGAP